METIETLNYRLRRDYGTLDAGMYQNWRIVWSEDQVEKRIVKHTDSGIELLEPEVREMPKYRQWIHNKYILERIMPMAYFSKYDLIEKVSYEPVWVFEDKDGNPLPPRWDVCTLVIDSILKNVAQIHGVKYKDDQVGSTTEEQREIDKVRIGNLQETLFGNETEVGDALAHKQAIIVPRSYENE